LTIDEDQHGSRRRQRREATLCAHRRGVVARCCMETNDAGARSSAHPGLLSRIRLFRLPLDKIGFARMFRGVFGLKFSCRLCLCDLYS